MSDELFRRAFRLTIANKQFGSVDAVRPLSFTFAVQRDKGLTPNNADVLIYNLSDDTRSELEQLSGGFGQGTGKARRTKLRSSKAKKPKKQKAGVAHAPDDADGVVVRIEAGYGENIGQIFFGVLRKVSSWRQGAEWITQISGGDGESAITTAKISKTFTKGTPLTAVVRALVGALGVGEGGLNATLNALDVTGFLAGGRTLQKALTMHGDAATNLDQFMNSLGFQWSIQDGAFYAGPSGTPTFPGQGPLLTPDTGLLDVPQIDRNGKLVGKALLNADLLPGRVVRVESTRVTGNFLVERTQHKGSSFGKDWLCEFVAAPPAKGSAAANLAASLGDTV
jgi:hypothetical protein